MSRPPDFEGEPIENKSQLIEDLESGCKPRENWRIGTEHEKFPFRLSDNKRLPYEEELKNIVVHKRKGGDIMDRLQVQMQ